MTTMQSHGTAARQLTKRRSHRPFKEPPDPMAVARETVLRRVARPGSIMWIVVERAPFPAARLVSGYDTFHSPVMAGRNQNRCRWGP
jgi:hypothetical protein